jgi:hypothetical protein
MKVTNNKITINMVCLKYFISDKAFMQKEI